MARYFKHKKRQIFVSVLNHSGMSKLDALIPEVEKLQEYQESGKWQQDFEADERGEVSLEVNRSVLSEDGLYDLLSDLDSLYSTFGDILTKAGVYDNVEEE